MFSQVCVSHSVHRGRGSLSRGSLSVQEASVRETPPRQRHSYGEEQAVRILLECILVYTRVKVKANFL